MIVSVRLLIFESPAHCRNSLSDSLRNPIIGGNSFRLFLKTFWFATYWCIQRIRGFTPMRYINRLFTYLLTAQSSSWTTDRERTELLSLLSCTSERNEPLCNSAEHSNAALWTATAAERVESELQTGSRVLKAYDKAISQIDSFVVCL